MKKILLFPAIIIGFTFLVSCFKTPGTEKLFDMQYVEFDLSTKASPVFRLTKNDNNGLPTRDSILVTLSGPQRNVPTTFKIKKRTQQETTVSGDTLFPIENVNYIFPDASFTIPANSSSVKVPIQYLDESFVAGKQYKLIVFIESADVDISKNYGKATILFGDCTYKIDNFTGNYRAEEPGYSGSPYNVTIVKKNATTITVQNFWDSNISADYTFNPSNGTISMVTFSNSGYTFSSSSPGTFDACTGTIVAPYKVEQAGSVVETNTHTYRKR